MEYFFYTTSWKNFNKIKVVRNKGDTTQKGKEERECEFWTDIWNTNKDLCRTGKCKSWYTNSKEEKRMKKKVNKKTKQKIKEYIYCAILGLFWAAFIAIGF